MSNMSASALEMQAVSALLDMLDKHPRVRRFQSESLVIELELPSQKLQPIDIKALEEEAQSEKCACGHLPFQHMNGLCTVGCDAAVCLPDVAQ